MSGPYWILRDHNNEFKRVVYLPDVELFAQITDAACFQQDDWVILTKGPATVLLEAITESEYETYLELGI